MSMSVLRRCLFTGLLFAVVVGRVFAFGTPEIRTIPAQLSGSYLPDADLAAGGSITVAGGIAAAFGLGFSAGGSGDYDDRIAAGPGGAVLRYQVVDAAATMSVLKDRDGAPDGSALLSGLTGVTGTQTFDVVASQAQLVTPGLYSDLLTVTLYSGATGGGGILETALLPIAITVEQFVQVSVVDPGGPYNPQFDTATLDFGILSSGATQSLDIVVLSNVGYQVSMESAQGGVLAHTDPTDGSEVIYQARADGVVLDLSSGPALVSMGSGPTSIDGNRYGLDFISEDPGNASDGLYEDVLTVTVTVL